MMHRSPNCPTRRRSPLIGFSPRAARSEARTRGAASRRERRLDRVRARMLAGQVVEDWGEVSARAAVCASSTRRLTRMDQHVHTANRVCCCAQLLCSPSDLWVSTVHPS
jgi:hypothetical protein